jgi:hypothetical protein
VSWQPREDADPCYRASAVALLKSHLQKCVRRNAVQRALSTTLHLWRLAPVELLRRVAIIAIEDVHLTSAYPTLVWLMCAASKNVPLDMNRVCSWLLGMVAQLASSSFLDHAIYKGRSAPALPQASLAAAARVREVGWRSCLYAMLVRRAFGGMEGDCNMLENCTLAWSQRFASGSLPPHARAAFEAPVVPVDPATLPPLAPGDWELAAVDFHCSDIGGVLQQRFGVSEERVREVMWAASSSTTGKRELMGALATDRENDDVSAGHSACGDEGRIRRSTNDNGDTSDSDDASLAARADALETWRLWQETAHAHARLVIRRHVR